MVFKIHGNAISTCTRRVAAVCKEYNLPYELVSVDFATGEHKSEAYTKIQPFGQVPYINDNGFTLYESRAISRYIATKYRKNIAAPLFPDPSTEPEKFAKFEEAASVETANFDKYASVIAAELIFKPMQGLKGDEALAQNLLTSLNANLDVYEKILSKQKYIAGNEISLVDIFHLPYASLLDSQKIIILTDEAKRPNVARWWKDITSRPSWQAVKGAVPASSA